MVDPLCGRIDANTAQSRTLAQLRETLLPKLMSGGLNVDDVKIGDAARHPSSDRLRGSLRSGDMESVPYQDLRLSASPRDKVVVTNAK